MLDKIKGFKCDIERLAILDRELKEGIEGFNNNMLNYALSENADENIVKFLSESLKKQEELFLLPSKSFYDVCKEFYMSEDDFSAYTRGRLARRKSELDNRFKGNILSGYQNKMREKLSDEYKATLKQKLDLFFFLEENGMGDLVEMSEELTTSLKSKTDVVVKPIEKGAVAVKDTVVKIGSPYAEVAKGQFEDLKKATTKSVNKGTKVLIKQLKKLEKKTSDK